MASRQFVRVLSACRPLASQRLVSLPRPLAVLFPTPRVPSTSIHTSSVRFSENIFNIQDADDFGTRVVKSSTPVVVDFHASWCGPCKLLGPRLESLVGARNGKVVLAKIDIDELSELAIDHGVEAVPTVIGMKDGKVVEKFVGLKDDADLETFLDKLAA